MSWADNIILAMGPLGIITIIVSAIRVGGPNWLKAIIGRAKENRAAAEVEIMSSTSKEVCELWNGQRVIRTVGEAPLAEFICLFPTANPTSERSIRTAGTSEQDSRHTESMTGAIPVHSQLCNHSSFNRDIVLVHRILSRPLRRAASHHLMHLHAELGEVRELEIATWKVILHAGVVIQILPPHGPVRIASIAALKTAKKATTYQLRVLTCGLPAIALGWSIAVDLKTAAGEVISRSAFPSGLLGCLMSHSSFSI